ncbi:chemotaxis protein MotC [Pseudochelatococcus contaminans]|uniref:Chemotaxis protein MotC n=1 Tax=Pseudochelatococcus contaminans TaxID=1538103 RepID=A0A7W5Z1Z1_9HYPH|nr:chemotaxis protein MotC [Pseudochelatococcus contaminans]MBB3808359.1 chemotaxis protein MotC [Pseudochelatococcus contaminans]
MSDILPTPTRENARTTTALRTAPRWPLVALAACGMLWMITPAAAETTNADTELPAVGTAEAREPYQLVRTLQAVQDRTAHGSRMALSMQGPLLSKTNAALLSAPDEAWQEPRNARAAIAFALSGGSPAILRKLVALDPRPAIDPAILDGVAAYIMGDEETARKHLGDMDASTLSPGIDGRIALVQSALYARTNPDRAVKLLDMARLLMPGTLVDEGALRREIFLTGQLELNDKFKQLTKHYLRRYPSSVYAKDFHQRFSSTLLRMNMSGTPEQEAWLTDLLEALDVPNRIDINLRLARQAVTQGKTRMASLAAKRAMELAPGNSSMMEQARLYYGSAIILDEKEFLDGQTILASIDRQRLPTDDTGLLDSALYITTRIRQMPVMPTDQSSASPPPASDKPLPAAIVESVFAEKSALDTTASRVKDLLGKSDELIKEGMGS